MERTGPVSSRLLGSEMLQKYTIDRQLIHNLGQVFFFIVETPVEIPFKYGFISSHLIRKY